MCYNGKKIVVNSHLSKLILSVQFSFSINTRSVSQCIQPVRNCKSAESKKFHLQVGASFFVIKLVGDALCIPFPEKFARMQISPRCFFVEKFKGTVPSKTKRILRFKLVSRIDRGSVKIHMRTGTRERYFVISSMVTDSCHLSESSEKSSKCTFNTIEFF